MITLKGVIEGIAASSWAGRVRREYRSGRSLILAYHNVVPAGTTPAGDRSLHLDFDQFRRQLDGLSTLDLAISSLDDVLVRATEAPRVAFTFDDAYLGAVALALPELMSRGWPATLFVAPGILGRLSLWWDEVTSPAEASALRSVGLDELAGEHDRIVAWRRQRGVEPVPTPPEHRIATVEELSECCRANPGLLVGAHSWSHPDLTKVEPGRLHEELRSSLEWIAARMPERYRPWIAYPYGHSDERVRAAAAQAGYQAGFEVAGGWHDTSQARLGIARFNVPAGISVPGFIGRANGFLPA